ncbi:hypothetical protein [Microbacterium sp. YY-01]|uniref:hypothetical protein n=1 Tax=Microbacterium sp. YY-01 TaxID=3421634 RepID=UPI003D16A1EF
MMSRISVAIIAVCLLLYIGAVGWLAFIMFRVAQPVSIAMGAGLIVIAAIGAWALWREIVFGMQSTRIAQQLDSEGGMPSTDAPLSPTGRLAPADAEPLVQQLREEVDRMPQQWRAHLRLGIALDAAGRRREARGSIVTATRLYRTESAKET